MNAQVLIDSIVRQVTVLIAQLAMSGGIRAPLAHVANQVFLDLARELQEQGVSRKVSADMFGMALRAYIRKVRRLGEAQSERGRTLWQAVLDFVRAEKLVHRERVLSRFDADGELQVTAVLHDLTESGLLFCSGSGKAAVYRAASAEDLDRLMQLSDDAGLDELGWVLIYREGPLTETRLQELLGRSPATTTELVQRLLDDGQVQRQAGGQLVARDFFVPLGATAGWEAAVFDHLQAVVQTVCQRLRQTSSDAEVGSLVGGSTYSFDVWPGHPLEKVVKAQLAEIRTQLGALRQEVERHNQAEGVPQDYQQVVTYVGQCFTQQSGRVETQEEEVEHDESL
ncbi:MAG TPA: MarR family transcriptional regulator [Polyangiaceae bacterium]|nr:MarR family transcriptional regulator [Polyangiaceae bacterium]